MKILIMGCSGFLGRHLMPVLLKHYGPDQVVGLSRRDGDLMLPGVAEQLLERYRPQVLINLAAYVGGIGANRAYPADFFYRNIMLSIPVFKAAYHAGVQKMIYPMGGCSYPAQAISPISEDQMWQGYPQKESAPYSLAKAMGLIASSSFRAQYGFNSVVVIPGNMYGEYDNFRTAESHVVPALVRRFYEARLKNLSEVPAWGSGKPERDFVYAGDVAALFPFFIDHYDSSDPVNLSSGTRTTIRELTETVAERVGYRGKVSWDASKPDGQMVKIFDVNRMKSLGLNCSTQLSDGLQYTSEWFMHHYAQQGDDLRL